MKPKPQFWRDLITIAFFIMVLVCCLKNVSAWKAREAAKRWHAKVSADRETFVAEREELKVLSASYQQYAQERREMMTNIRKLMRVCKKPGDRFPVFEDLVIASQEYQRTDGMDLQVVVPKSGEHVLRVLLQHAAVPTSNTVVDFNDHVLGVLLDEEMMLDSEVSQLAIDKVLSNDSEDPGGTGDGAGDGLGNGSGDGFVVKLNEKLIARIPFRDVARLTGSYSSSKSGVAIRPNQPGEFKFTDSWIYRGGLSGEMPDGQEHRIILTCWLDQDQTPTVAADDPAAVEDILFEAKRKNPIGAAIWNFTRRFEYQGDGIYSVQPMD